MNKLTGTTPDQTEKNIDKIAELFPQVVTETVGEDGVPTRAVDFDLLRQALSSELVEGDERYRLDWPGKRASLLKANTPIAKTLRPDFESSVDFDTAQNIFIEGDNFEALKILQESYLGKVKMIYIDPPYNTGKDFVYSDNFTQDKTEYEEEIEAVDEEGNKLFRENTRTNPRFHSDWLSMMYERLTIARDLLRDNGVIFISIDDNEVHNLRKVCDEIFGENNFVAQIVWQNKEGGGGSDSRLFKIKHEYILCYGKSVDLLDIQGIKPNNIERYTETDRYENTRGKHLLIKLESGSLGYVKSLDYPISAPDGTDINPNQDDQKIKRWRWSKRKYEWGLKNDYVVIKKDQANNWSVYTKQYLNADNEGNIVERRQNPIAVIDEFSTTQSAKNLADLFGGRYFDYPKPVNIIKWLLDRVVCKNKDIILDFFSGSATTAHAVMAINADDGGKRKFIMVQLPEQTPEDSEARKAGYQTITEIGRERIRRAAEKIKVDYVEELAKRATPLDTGFRAYTVADTAFLDVKRHPSELGQGQLLKLADNIKPDRAPADLLTEVMLDLGLTLDLPIETKKIGENTVFSVAHNALVACFDLDVPLTLIDEMAKSEPLQVAFRDASFGSDDALINAETHLKRLSSDTIFSVI